MDRVLTFLERWVARPVSIVTAFVAIFGVLAWVYQQFVGAQLNVELVPVQLDLPQPPRLDITLPNPIPSDWLESLFAAFAVSWTAAALIVWGFSRLERWRSVIADILAVLVPPTYGLGVSFLVGLSAVGSADEVAVSNVLLAGLATGVVSLVAWFKFSPKERFEFLTGEKMGCLVAFYHLFWVRYFGLCLAFGWMALCVVIGLRLTGQLGELP